MYVARAIVLGIILAVASPGSAQAQPTITIDSITKDGHISGRVTGITDSARKTHKVVVYVKTDKWYIHPFAQGGDGKSWALIASNGSWRIETKFREPAASSMAALVVPKNAEAPSASENVHGIASQAIVEKQLEGTPDYGKL